MRKIILLFALAWLIGPPVQAEGEKSTLIRNWLHIYPQVGLSMNSPSQLDLESKSGLILGAGIRLGKRHNFVTGIYYHSNIFEGNIDPNAPAGSGSQRAYAEYMVIPAAYGYHLIQRDLVKIKVSLGASYYQLLNGNYSPPQGLQDLDFTEGLISGRAGFGVEIWRITVDLNYDLGFTNTFTSTTDTKNRLLHATLGFQF